MSFPSEGWKPGTPCWVDLTVPDLGGADDFYVGLFGWQAERGGRRTEYRLDGQPVASICEDAQADAWAWTTYLAVENLELTKVTVERCGGRVVCSPVPHGLDENMALIQDPAGAVLGLWQVPLGGGSASRSQVGAMVWHELMTRDVGGALDFYRDVVGLTFRDVSSADYRYLIGQVDGQDTCGIGQMDPTAATVVPSHWMTHFRCHDTDRHLDRVSELGGLVVHPPMDSPYGRMAIVQGRFEERFALVDVEASAA